MIKSFEFYFDFGSPYTFIVNNKIFWGQDRLEFAINEAKKNNF